MRLIFVAISALSGAGAALAQTGDRPNPSDPKAKSAAVEFRSALEGYKSFEDQPLRDWRKANEEVRVPATPKPQPGKPEKSGHGSHK